MTVSPPVAEYPKTPQELEEWLQLHCKAGELSTNITSFTGKRYEDYQKTKLITDGSWFLFDEHRERYAEHAVRLYHDKSQPLSCLNMVIPAGSEWYCRPFLDFDTEGVDVFERLLRHANIQTDVIFYLAVRQAFGDVLFGTSAEAQDRIHDDEIAFSRQPSNRHKFHLVYIGKDPIVWSKEKRQSSISRVAKYLNTKFRLEELHAQGPMVPAVLPSKENPKGKPPRFWVTNYKEDVPFESLHAAFIDVGAKGLRPLGCSKHRNVHNRDNVYHVYRINSTPIMQVPLTKDLFLAHLVVLPGQDTKRIPRKHLDLGSVDESDEAGEDEEDVQDVQDVEVEMEKADRTNSEIQTHSPHLHVRKWVSTVPDNVSAILNEDTRSMCSHKSTVSEFLTTSSNKKKKHLEDAGATSTKKMIKKRSRILENRSQQSLGSHHRRAHISDRVNPSTEDDDFFLEMGMLAAKEGRHSNHIANAKGKGAKKEGGQQREPSDPCRPTNRRIYQGLANKDLEDYVVGNIHLPWGKDLKRCGWTIGRLAQKARHPNLSSIMTSLDALGITNQVFTLELAIKICSAWVNHSGEYFAEILQCLVGTHNGKQGRIEVDGGSGNALQWWLFIQEKHGWTCQKGNNTHILTALRGVFIAFREYLTRLGGNIEEVAPDSEAKSWFSEADIYHHHPILLCYDEVIRMINGQNGSRTCQQSVQLAWEGLIRNNCIVPGGSIVNALNEDKYKTMYVNGVYDLKEYHLRDGRPEDYTSYSFGYHYRDWRTEIIQGYDEKGEEIIKPDYINQVKEWRQFFAQIMPLRELRFWFFRVLASCMGGLPPDALYILSGAGSNGKSVFIKLLEILFGAYYATISSAKLTEKKGHSSGADPQTLQLKGIRVRADTEPEEGVPLNAAYVKARFDTQTARGLYEGSAINQQHFYKHFLACNTTPPSSGDECNTRRQIHIPMMTRFSFNPNLADKLDMKADEFVGVRSVQWCESLNSYLVSLWQKYDAGNVQKSDPLQCFQLPTTVKNMNDRFKKEGDFGVAFVASLKKSQYGFKEFNKIWQEYKDAHDAEFKGDDKRHNQKISKVQMYRHLQREFGQPQVIPFGSDKGEYYRCYNPNAGDTEKFVYDEKSNQVQGSLGDQFASDLDKVRSGDHALPSNRDYDKIKPVGKAAAVSEKSASVSKYTDLEDASTYSDGESNHSNSSGLGPPPEVTSSKYRKRFRKEENEDLDFASHRSTKSRRIQQGGSNSGSSNHFSDNMSQAITEISVVEEYNFETLKQKRKRKMAERLIDCAVSETSLIDDHSVAGSVHENPAKRPRQQQKIGSDDDDDDGYQHAPVATTTTIFVPPSLDTAAGALPSQEQVSAAAAVAPPRKKKNRNHKNTNKFLDEGANVSDDDGEADEDDDGDGKDIATAEDLAFIDDNIADHSSQLE